MMFEPTKAPCPACFAFDEGPIDDKGRQTIGSAFVHGEGSTVGVLRSAFAVGCAMGMIHTLIMRGKPGPWIDRFCVEHRAACLATLDMWIADSKADRGGAYTQIGLKDPTKTETAN